MNDEWRTPPELFVRLDGAFDFTLDPAATPENSLCPQFYTWEDDGLAMPWRGHRAFCNPPYSRGQLGLWLRHGAAEAEEGGLAVFLIPHDPSTRYWQHFIDGSCDHRKHKGRPRCPFDVKGIPVVRARAVNNLEQRVRFIDPVTGKPIGSPTFSSSVVAYW